MKKEQYVKMFESWQDAVSKNHTSSIQIAMLNILSIIKMLHWNTETHKDHEAWGDLYSTYSWKMDSIIESLIGNIELDPNLPLSTLQGIEGYSLDEIEVVIKDPKPFLNNIIILLNFIKEWSPNIANTADDLITEVTQTAYKLSLK